MKKTVFLLLLIISTYSAHAQQLPLYSQYLYNQYLINPAIAGSDGYTSINVTTRRQWVGLIGAPEVSSLSFQTRFLKRGYVLNTRKNGRQIYRPQRDSKVGLGGYLFTYNSGVIQRTGFQASYVYHTWLRYTTQLSLSLGFTGYHLRIKEEDIVFEDPDDPMLYDRLRRGIFVPDVVFGAYLLNVRYSIGFSADQLLGAFVKIGDNGLSEYKMSRHFYLMCTYSFFFGKKFELRPSVLLKMSEQLKPQATLGSQFNYDNSLWAGISYRTDMGGTLIANVGVRYDRYYLGYAFDFSLSELHNVTYGTHEFTLAVKFGDSLRKYRWLDRY
jgi:type IX secretion system PorP/SprF family membrane protein